MPRIDDIFARHRAQGRGTLMPFVTAGYPTLEATEQVIPALEEAGASIVELGVPFSDPIADGPVIAASMHDALTAGVSPRDVFALAARVRPATAMGLIAMVSHSIVDRFRPEHFIAEAAASGIDGLIIPDIDLGTAEQVAPMATARGLTFSLLVAPTTTPERMARLASLSTGFIYLLARVGITGERHDAPDIERRVEELRAVSDLPIAVGFGIAKAEHVSAVTRCADAAIIGSALVQRMGSADDPVRAARDFVAELATGLGAGVNTEGSR